MARDDESIIIRKLAAMESGGDQRKPPPPLPAALFRDLALHIEKTRRPLFRCRLVAALEDHGVHTLGEALGALSDPAPIAILSVEGPQTPALIAFDPALAFHAVDLILGGDPAQNPAPPQRSFSGIDTRLAGQIIGALADDFMRVLKETHAQVSATGMRQLSLEYEPSMARVVPEDAPVLTARLRLTLGEAGRTGCLTLILPVATVHSLGAAGLPAAPSVADDDPWSLQMRQTVLELELDVVAATARLEMTVAELSRLDVGQMLEIPSDALQDVALLVETEDGIADLGKARLGSHRGHKALKLQEAPDPLFLAPMRQLIDKTA